MSSEQSPTNYGNRALHIVEATTTREILQMEREELDTLKARLVPANERVNEALRRVNQLRAELAAAENALRDAQDYARRAQDNITALETRIKERKALLHPLRKLPDEMLQEIFVQCIQAVEEKHQSECYTFSNAPLTRHTSPFLTALTLSHVCKRWYVVAHAASRLWTHIHCDLAGQPSSVAHDRWRHSQALANKQGMHITLNAWEEGGHPHPAHRTDSLLNRLNEHAIELNKDGTRDGYGWSIRRLDIYFKSNVHTNRMATWKGPMPQELNIHCQPNTNRLGLLTPIPSFITSMIEHATKVSLSGLSVWDNRGTYENLRQVSLCSIQSKSIVECLKKCPNLEELRIDSIFPQQVTESLTHKSLKHLSLPFIAIVSSHTGFPEQLILPNVITLTMTHLDLLEIERLDQSSINYLTHFANNNLPSVSTLHFDSVIGGVGGSPTAGSASERSRYFPLNFFDGLQAFHKIKVIQLDDNAVTPFIQGWNRIKNTDGLEDIWPCLQELSVNLLRKLPPVDTPQRSEYFNDLGALRELLFWRVQRKGTKESASSNQSPAQNQSSEISSIAPSSGAPSSTSASKPIPSAFTINNIEADDVLDHCTLRLEKTSH